MGKDLCRHGVDLDLLVETYVVINILVFLHLIIDDLLAVILRLRAGEVVNGINVALFPVALVVVDFKPVAFFELILVEILAEYQFACAGNKRDPLLRTVGNCLVGILRRRIRRDIVKRCPVLRQSRQLGVAVLMSISL